MTTTETAFRELIQDKRKFIETLLVIENKARQRIPFIYNAIQADVDATQTGRDIWVKPSQVGFSSERIANRLVDTLTVPGTNTILIAYEDFITERLLSKVTFFYNHLASLGIPGFPEMHHDSTYEKTFRFHLNGRLISTSSIYIASARSYVAGRAETIHHLLCDEYAFWAIGATERILLPAMARIPEGGTCDIFSTPNGEENDFHDIYITAKEGNSVFTQHFYAWFQHLEYQFGINDHRCLLIADGIKPEFDLNQDEGRLFTGHNLTYDQIRWRRWKIKEMESLRRTGETRTLFPQEFPEDDVSCFLATGDMYYDITVMDDLAKGCYPAKYHRDGAHVWYPPEEGKSYVVSVDPGQAKITQSAITVWTWDTDEYGNQTPRYCARDAGLYSPEVTDVKADNLCRYYNGAMKVWEANAHGLAISVLNKWKNIYYRKDIVSGMVTIQPGWLTGYNKDYMLSVLHRALPNMRVHDIEFISQLRNIRQPPPGSRAACISVGADDIHDSGAIALVCHDPHPTKKGFIGGSGWKW